MFRLQSIVWKNRNRNHGTNRIIQMMTALYTLYFVLNYTRALGYNVFLFTQ